MSIQSVRGCQDILPQEAALWQKIEMVTREVFELYGYAEIRTPVLEKAELFCRGVGAETDIVQKEMYLIESAREGNLALRPEGTAAVVRAYNEHKLYAVNPVPEKLYYLLPMFRRERPQAGRYRQFHQIGAEALGIDSPAIDAEMIAMVFHLLARIHLAHAFEVQLNSVGCQACRPAYRDRLKNFLTASFDQLCADCQTRFERNPMRILDCKQAACQQLVTGAPVMLDCYCAACQEHFTALQEYLGILRVPFVINPKMVRGLDYYVRTAFEFVSSALGAQSAILGGGRYDGLSEMIGGAPLPGVGFAMGVERVIALLNLPVATRPSDVFIAVLGESVRATACALQRDLRAANIRTEIEYQAKSLKSQMKKASKFGVAYVVMLGADELQKGTVTVRDMRNSTQQEAPLNELANTLKILLLRD